MKSLIIFCLFLAFAMPKNVNAQEVRTEVYGGRTIEEAYYSEFNLRKYKIGDILMLRDSIHHQKSPFSESTKYPVWKDPIGIKQVFKDVRSHTLQCFTKRNGNAIPSEYLAWVKILINDDGRVLCYEITTNECLFNIYTVGDILDIFDEINTFRFPTPVVVQPQTGYEEITLHNFD